MANRQDHERRRPNSARRNPTREDRERQWRRFDEDDEFRRRPGALDRRWGYGDRLAPDYRSKQWGDQGSEFEAPDPYNAPDYWVEQEEWLQPGPYEGLGPKGYRRSDERILEDVCDRLTQHPQIDASDIEVQVQEGEVTLSGTVENRRIKRMVEANVDLISGVVDVHNRLRLRHLPSREEIAAEKLARSMAERFPGGPTPVGNAGYGDPENESSGNR